MSTRTHRETSLFHADVTQGSRRWLRPSRWQVVTGLVLLGLATLLVSSVVSLTRAVLHRDARRDSLMTWAKRAMPADAHWLSTGFIGPQDAYAMADVPRRPVAVLSAFGPDWGGAAWNEIPGTATGSSRSYLSSGQDRILEVTADPCARGRTHCPPGGSTVTVEVSVGGPKS